MRSKYGAKKTQVDEIVFDSRAEAKRYRELMLLKRAGEVVEVVLQPSYVLMPGFKHKATGKRVQAITYITKRSRMSKELRHLSTC
jgi:hypothetical protein